MFKCDSALSVRGMGCSLNINKSSLFARKGKDPEFDYKKLAFVQDASGKQAEDLVVAAQSNVQNARRSSLQAAYSLFKTSLQNDHVVHDKHIQACEMSSQRARSVLVSSLEAGRFGSKPFFFTVNE